MEKVICALWRNPDETAEAFNNRLLSSLCGELEEAGATLIRMNLRDANVAPAQGLVQQWQAPQQDAVVQFWLSSANPRFRTACDAALARHSSRFAAWLVSESTIIPNTDHPPSDDARTAGWSQASFITFRDEVTRASTLAHWHDHHTRVAIETQSNFEYIQNLIVMPLTEGAPQYDAFVEECFPLDAMTNPAVFFDAVEDHAKFGANVAAMTDSCNAFIDFARIDVLPTSQFDFIQTGDHSRTVGRL